MDKSSKIYVAGHGGMVGSAIVRKLIDEGYQNIISRTIEELDLTDQQAVVNFFRTEKPEYVFMAAAKVGGIQANNTYRAQFIYENLMIQNNIIHQSYLHNVKKLLFLGSSCVYPKNCPQPIKEEYLLTGELEPTNEPYAIAKIAGIKMCENYYRQYGCDFISVMPTNLYGPNDNYNLETSHVLPAILRKMHLAHCLETGDWEAIWKDLNKRPIEGVNGSSTQKDILGVLGKYGIQPQPRQPHPLTLPIRGVELYSPVNITLWGSGKVYREFMHVDDMAEACVMLMRRSKPINRPPSAPPIRGGSLETTDNSFINIGTGVDQTIYDLALIIKEVTGFKGEFIFDQTHPDGTYKKLLDISRLNALAFKPEYTLQEGIENVFMEYKKN